LASNSAQWRNIRSAASKPEFDPGVGPFHGHVLNHGVIVKIPIHVGISHSYINLAKAVIDSGERLPGRFRITCSDISVVVDIPLFSQVSLTPGANDEIPIASGILLTPRADGLNIIFEVGVYRKIAPAGQQVEEFRSFRFEINFLPCFALAEVSICFGPIQDIPTNGGKGGGKRGVTGFGGINSEYPGFREPDHLSTGRVSLKTEKG